MAPKKITKPLDRACPFLGTEHDPQVCYDFPHTKNFCYRCKKPGPINISYQEFFCLSINHSECSIIQENDLPRLPKELSREHRYFNRFPSKWVLPFIIGAILVVSILALIFFEILNNNPSGTSLSLTAQVGKPTTFMAVSQSTEGPVETSTSFTSTTNTPSASQTPTPEAEAGLTSTPGPDFSTPFGITRRYLFHQVGMGESLPYIADLYNTSIESISEINSNSEGTPILLDQILIIQQGSTEPSEKFQAIQIEIESPVQTIAEEYNISVEKLIDLNALGHLDTIPAGRWLIVPQS